MSPKSSISSHVRISYRFYQFVTTRYTTDFYIIKIISKVPRLEFLTCLKVVSRKVPKELKRKASLSKSILKRKTAKIFVSHLLQLSLQKNRCKSLFI